MPTVWFMIWAAFAGSADQLFGKPLSFNKFKAAHREGSQVDDYFFFQLSYPNGLNVMAASDLD